MHTIYEENGGTTLNCALTDSVGDEKGSNQSNMLGSKKND